MVMAMKMLFYLLLAVISQCTSNEASQPDDITDHDNHDNEQCVCLNSTGDLVTNHIYRTSSDNKLERLVVYIYKDTASNVVYMYTPKNEKQLLFPDLTYDEEDELSIMDSETVSHIVTDSPHRVFTQNTKLKVDPQNGLTEYDNDYNNIPGATFDNDEDEYAEDIPYQYPESSITTNGLYPDKTDSAFNFPGNINGVEFPEYPLDASTDGQIISEQSFPFSNANNVMQPSHSQFSNFGTGLPKKIYPYPNIDDPRPTQNFPFSKLDINGPATNFPFLDMSNVGSKKIYQFPDIDNITPTHFPFIDIEEDSFLDIDEDSATNHFPNLNLDDGVPTHDFSFPNVHNSVPSQNFPYPNIANAVPTQNLPFPNTVSSSNFPFLNTPNAEPTQTLPFSTTANTLATHLPNSNTASEQNSPFSILENTVSSHNFPFNANANVQVIPIKNNEKKEEPQIFTIDQNMAHGNLLYDSKDTDFTVDLPEINEEYPQMDPFQSEDFNSQIDITQDNYLRPQSFEKYVTFDTWFDQQMLRINKTGKTPNRNIDLTSLKLLVEKTLYDNHMYITKDGVLIDSYGNRLRVANLKLRPILIGTSVPYNILLNVKDNMVQLPSVMPYLEAVLVTLVFPPKVLGVIPLGKTYVPRVSYRRGFNFWPPKRLPKYCITGHCTTTKEIIFGFRKASPYNRNQSYYKKSPFSGVSPLLRPKPSIPSYSKTLKSYNKKKTGGPNKRPSPAVFNNEDQSYQGKHNILSFIKSLLNFDTPRVPRINTHVQDNVEPVEDLEKPEEVDISSYYEDDVDDTGLDFRIIGGSAATSSGTPVNNRGRSGVVLDS